MSPHAPVTDERSDVQVWDNPLSVHRTCENFLGPVELRQTVFSFIFINIMGFIF